ncbi:hypothetical protein [Aquimarina mytili]|uniref:Uncharacterized protein n=1 Tax=Aquimarina mytili TaxID=874423 RepID=A0A937D4H4_9FLAO|nr:hypothetical protein [Aquimarina mytili]MBL0682194.1 hypothetical protein [Aquimarina mytili]
MKTQTKINIAIGVVATILLFVFMTYKQVEKGKHKKLEIEALFSICYELNRNLVDLNSELSSDMKSLKSYKKIDSIFKLDLAYRDELKYDFYLVIQDYGSYFDIETQGISRVNVIKDDTLGVNIRELYKYDLRSLPIIRYSDLDIDIREYYQNHFKIFENKQEGDVSLRNRNKLPSKGYKPNDFERLKNDPHYRSILDKLLKRRNHKINMYKQTIHKVEKTMRRIENYTGIVCI